MIPFKRLELAGGRRFSIGFTRPGGWAVSIPLLIYTCGGVNMPLLWRAIWWCFPIFMDTVCTSSPRAMGL